jgi:hypothetical protein
MDRVTIFVEFILHVVEGTIEFIQHRLIYGIRSQKQRGEGKEFISKAYVE